MTMRKMIMKTYRQNTTCDEFTCNNKSSIMTQTGNCEINKDMMGKGCEGKRKYDYSCTRLLNNLKYLRSLFEKPKNKEVSISPYNKHELI